MEYVSATTPYYHRNHCRFSGAREGWVVWPSLFCEWWERWNSPYINHFIQPDTIIPDQTSPQSWDRYAYVQNNPLKYTDPTGHKYCLKDDKCDDNILTGSGKDFFKEYKGYSAQERNVLRKLYNDGGADAQHGVEYILAHRVHITVDTGWQSGFGSRSGWFDEFTNTVTLNYDYLRNFNKNRTLSDLTPWAYSIIIHEALHIEQGSTLSHSIEGERLGWQAGIRVYKNLSPSSAIEFAPGAPLQNILEDTTPEDFIDDITWDPLYKYSMLFFYKDPWFPNCGNGGYCPPLAGP